VQVFNQLLDHNRMMLAQVNQPLSLTHGAPYYLWNPHWLKSNSYRLQIPEDAAGGLYTPYIGLYEVETGAQFDARQPDGTAIPDGVFLSPLKVARRTAAPLANPLSIRFGDGIHLEGYEVALPAEGLQPQSTMTLTLQYQNLAPVTVDYTQFVHLDHAELGIAAQHDQPPQGNPTSSWIPGEVIVEVIPLEIAPDAQPGVYTLSMGLYDPLSDGARLPVLENGSPLPDNKFVIAELEIE
jgi:hypothetical protein